jgi:hypothetical protein
VRRDVLRNVTLMVSSGRSGAFNLWGVDEAALLDENSELLINAEIPVTS